MPPSQLDALAEADRRLVRTVDGLSDDALRGPSVLPGWSRAHVVAHLALNAEGLVGVLEGLAHGRDEPMYASEEARDADVEELAAASSATLRDRLLAASSRFRDAARRAPDEPRGRIVQRTPGNPAFPAGTIVPWRRREVEIHHADLDAGYGPADWPAEFLETTFHEIVEDRQDGPAMLLRSPEGEAVLGNGRGATVSGSRADMTWWLLGRGAGEGLTCGTVLPVLGKWR